jgi:hypothetical protein
MDDNKKLFIIQMKVWAKLKKKHVSMNHEDVLYCEECIALSNNLMKVLPVSELLEAK